MSVERLSFLTVITSLERMPHRKSGSWRSVPPGRLPLTGIWPRRLWCTAVAALFSGACSGATLQGVVYKGDGLAFRVGEIPASWTRLSVSHTRLAFRDDAAEASVLVNARCGKDGDDVPLLALTKHLFMSFTEKETLHQNVVPMDGREAMHTILSAKLDGVPKAFDAFVLKKDGCVYDFVCISPPAKFEENRAPFERFVAGFRTLPEDS